ncbi:unnamed protein product [Bursaphelenchus xylophilus]|uniref:Lipase n=1 Tax=Bursaphelenchus xylophilus TaxID=6326 RepID=A0A1I7S245_BURXY|nr:unnamed protein product [Bursaphelenchus xylophilus]CAG9114925.1 unnamed protein product [Bursaphelenchus xylophilus]
MTSNDNRKIPYQSVGKATPTKSIFFYLTVIVLPIIVSFIFYVDYYRIYDVEEDLDTMGIIKHWGYQGEEHIAKTKDGWSLKIHRIPRGKNEVNDKPKRPVIILQHGIECSSDNWILNLPHQSPGFVFADAGFDVWMANSRGNIYTSHANYSRHNSEFWHYTSDDMQRYDLPALFDLIANITGQSQFYYVGHSQGTYIMFTKLSDDPSFSHRVKKFFALGPGVRFQNIQGPFKFVCDSSEAPILSRFWDWTAYTEFGLGLLGQHIVKFLTRWTCATSAQKSYCSNIFYWFSGSSSTLNESRIAVYTNHIPTGISTATIQKYCQTIDPVTGGFKFYKFPTREENLEKYGQEDAPYYNLTKMDVPLYLYSCPNDILTTEQQLDEAIIPNLKKGILKEDNRYHGFSHMDLLWGLNATEMVFEKIIKVINADYN